ncbi:MAG: Gfo/Idh/MocA family protein [Acidimicrobiales bacterium]
MADPVNLGIIGGGLMGKEVATAVARWPALVDHPARPRVTAVCDIDPVARAWFDGLGTVKTSVSDYHDLLADDEVEVVYVAVRHDLHEAIYTDVVGAGKDLLAEKPFGIDIAAAERIVAAIEACPTVFVRCSSEFPFFPGAQAVVAAVVSGELGDVIEASNTFSHSSDLDVTKPVSWKRQAGYCGAAGVMNDLGLHVTHVPLRLGWDPAGVYAVLQDLVPNRPGPDGAPVACDTWENATLLCTVAEGGRGFPLTLATKRIDPGQKNTWALRVTGMRGGVAYSTRCPKTVWKLALHGPEQVWGQIEMGSQSPRTWPTITGPIFEFGFPDAILQMLAAFFAERSGALGDRFGCVTPGEALASHRIFDAALRSHDQQSAVATPHPARAGPG